MRKYPEPKIDPKYGDLLRAMANDMGVVAVYDELISQYPQFLKWSGSSKETSHHYGFGELARHTWEIVEVGMHTISVLNLNKKVDPREFYLAALFHDTGKMFDYKLVDDDRGTYGDPIKPYFTSAEHRRLIYHLPKSTLIWHDIIGKFPELRDKYHDAVLHDILAHHGQREYGSPVAPKTHTAWLLHLSDSMSARLDDADRRDMVKDP